MQPWLARDLFKKNKKKTTPILSLKKLNGVKSTYTPENQSRL